MALFMHDFIIKERFLADLRQGPHTGCTLGNITPLLATASRRCHSGTVFLLAWSLILYLCRDYGSPPEAPMLLQSTHTHDQSDSITSSALIRSCPSSNLLVTTRVGPIDQDTCLSPGSCFGCV